MWSTGWCGKNQEWSVCHVRPSHSVCDCVHLPLFCHCHNVLSELCASDAGICVLREREISGNHQPDWKSVGIINDDEDLVVVVIQVCCCVVCINADHSGVSSLYRLTASVYTCKLSGCQAFTVSFGADMFASDMRL